jgi:hypothetical protein
LRLRIKMIVASQHASDAGPSTVRQTSEQVMARLSRDFADGESGHASRDQDDELIFIATGDSLSRHQQINARLQLEIMDVQDEVSKLKVELRQNQDPSKMTRIQAQIGVSYA